MIFVCCLSNIHGLARIFEVRVVLPDPELPNTSVSWRNDDDNESTYDNDRHGVFIW